MFETVMSLVEERRCARTRSKLKRIFPITIENIYVHGVKSLCIKIERCTESAKVSIPPNHIHPEANISNLWLRTYT